VHFPSVFFPAGQVFLLRGTNTDSLRTIALSKPYMKIKVLYTKKNGANYYPERSYTYQNQKVLGTYPVIVTV
jgi:hypothetical protein